MNMAMSVLYCEYLISLVVRLKKVGGCKNGLAVMNTFCAYPGSILSTFMVTHSSLYLTPENLIPAFDHSLGYPAFSLRCGNTATLGLKDCSLHVVQQITNGVNVAVDKHILLLQGLDSYRVGQPSRSPHH